MSTDAILGYGYAWDQEDLDSDDTDNIYELIEESNEKYPLCNVGIHCHTDVIMLYITVKRLKVTAHRGYPKTLGVISYPTHEELQQLIELYKEVCEVYEENPLDAPFSYFICSYWG